MTAKPNIIETWTVYYGEGGLSSTGVAAKDFEEAVEKFKSAYPKEKIDEVYRAKSIVF